MEKSNVDELPRTEIHPPGNGRKKLPPLPRLSPPPREARLAWLGVLCAILVAVGSVACKTYWFYGRHTSASYCGILPLDVPIGGLATLLLWIAAVKLDLPLRDEYVWPRRLGRFCTGLGAIVLAAAAGIAGVEWWQRLEELWQPRDYHMTIALGLPIATVAGTIGAVLALAAAWVAARSDHGERLLGMHPIARRLP